MSFVSNQLRRLDAQLDKLQLAHLDRTRLPEHPAEARSLASTTPQTTHPELSDHAQSLQRLIRQLGAASDRTSPHRLISLLDDAAIAAPRTTAESEEHARYERELEWLLLSKVAIQTYGIVLNYLVDQTLPLSEDLFYWDSVLGSTRYTAFYLLQTFPERLYNQAREVISESLRRLEEIRLSEAPAFLRRSPASSNASSPPRSPVNAEALKESFTTTAQKFYGLVRNTIEDRAYSYHLKALSPFSLARTEIREKQEAIRKLREMQAAAVGVLIGEGLSFEITADSDEWRGIVERAVVLMENVVTNVSTISHTLETFEETVFNLERPNALSNAPTTTAALSSQLRDILTTHLPTQSAASRRLTSTHGRPHPLTRYWLPATALLLSSTTLLRLITANRATLDSWLRELGRTTLDFWFNWVITPLRNIIGTIRHDADSELALMSRKSLVADMESLQNMVVDFSLDNPTTADTSDITALRQLVKEGDLSPVLRAYEHELRAPLRGALRGNLVRALLIQIQKTKVDVEVAIAGIDRLLKSQELVFGFVGLTPGVVISLGLVRWLASLRARSRNAGRTKGQAMRRLRNVDRILNRSKGGEEVGGGLDYKEHGLLLCEVHALRMDVIGAMGDRVRRGEFEGDLEELCDVRGGVRRQLRVVDRIRWSYGKYLR